MRIYCQVSCSYVDSLGKDLLCVLERLSPRLVDCRKIHTLDWVDHFGLALGQSTHNSVKRTFWKLKVRETAPQTTDRTTTTTTIRQHQDGKSSYELPLDACRMYRRSWRPCFSQAARSIADRDKTTNCPTSSKTK